MIGKEIGATFVFLDESRKIAKRWGYGTKIRDVLSDYQPSGNLGRTSALVIDPPGSSLKETDLRFHHRLKVLPEYETSIQFPTLVKPYCS